MIRINAVQISSSDMSKRCITYSSYGCELSLPSLNEDIRNKRDEKPELGGETRILTLANIWHHVKQKQQKSWLGKTPDRGSR
jgi:hypothetical protein